MVAQCSNGSFSIVSEHGNNLRAAKKSFYHTCEILESADDVVTATVVLMDEGMNTYPEFTGRINHIQPSESEGNEGA